MSPILIILMALMQAYVSIDQFIKGNYAVGTMFAGYSIANVAYLSLIK